jgi:shikimate dehydrogenase
MPITGETRLAAVIGDPVRHSRSPAIHNAGYAAAGLDWVFVALPVPAGRGADAVAAMPVLGISGLSVTMPHKADAARACDTLTADARALGVVNTVVLRPDGTIWGDSTDGEGLVRSLADAGLELAGKSVLVVGAGGAARAAVLALDRAGAAVTVTARRPEAADEAAQLAPSARTAGLDAGLGEKFDVVLNATPVGMAGETLPIAAPGSGQWAVDLIYHPAQTPFLAAAATRGARVVGGLGMLVHQAVLGFEAMTGHPAPLAAMRAAAEQPPPALNPETTPPQ